MNVSWKNLLIAVAVALVAGACATTDRVTVASSSGRTQLGLASTNGSTNAGEFRSLASQSWVKDEDAKDKSGPDAIRY